MTIADPTCTAESVYLRVLRYIRKNRLGEGDRLPPQSQWLRMLSCGTIPFNSAMRLLERHGVVERRPTGTTLLRAAPKRPVTWSIGVCMPKLPTASAVYPTLLQYLLLHLQEADCRLHIYRFNRPTPLGYFNKIDDFDGLRRDVEAGRLDGLLNISRLGKAGHESMARHGVVSCQLISHHPNEPGVSADTPEMIRQAVTLLHDKGCRRIALAYPTSDACRESFGDRHQRAFAEAIAPLGPPLEFSGPEFAHGGRIVAQQLLDLPPRQRPDGLICIRDDHFTLGLTHRLRQDPDYRPRIAGSAARQAPLPFFLPVHRFEIDLEEMAHKGVQLLLNQLQSPHTADRRAILTPRLNDADAVELPRELKAKGLPAAEPTSGLSQRSDP